MITLTPSKELVFDLSELEKKKTVAVELKIANNSSSERVLFKIKTTKPQNYHVKPNSGIIPKGGAVIIQVALLEAAVNQPADSKAKEDKFLVQTIVESDCSEKLPDQIAPEEEAPIVKEQWTAVEAKGKSKEGGPNIMKNKLTCRLVKPGQTEASAPAPAKVEPTGGSAAATKPAATTSVKPSVSKPSTTTSKPASSASKSKPTAVAPSGGNTKTAGDQSMPSIILLFVVFLLGVIMGKFVI
mmetsp:Transcript_50307/g.69818  ORF Transcript_50307/g.69818 Transcript_50307/m.69818 type:complete len:242 (-) Transcript_50307:90-815(-)